MFVQINHATSSTSERYALTDGLGSVEAIQTVGQQSLDLVYASFVDRPVFADYDSYGNTVWKNAEIRPREGEVNSTQPGDWTGNDSLFSWTGRELDPVSGLQWNRARWYDPQVGRWLADDPIGFAAGDTNLQRYVGNSPTTYVDPSGLEISETRLGGTGYLHVYDPGSGEFLGTVTYPRQGADWAENRDFALMVAKKIENKAWVHEVGQGAADTALLTASLVPGVGVILAGHQMVTAPSVTAAGELVLSAVPGGAGLRGASKTATKTCKAVSQTKKALKITKPVTSPANTIGLRNTAPDATLKSKGSAAKHTPSKKSPVAPARTLPNSTRGWKVGDPINNLTSKGNVPTWSTVRQRYWKNQAHSNAANYSSENLDRMRRGLAPQRINPRTGQVESMELHHTPPLREGGLFDVQPFWPDDHALIDPFRNTGG